MIPKEQVMAPKLTNLEKAMAFLREQADKDLKKMFKLAALKSHPDRGGERGVFDTVNYIYSSITPFLNPDNKPSKAEVIQLAETLKYLPSDISKMLDTKIKAENPQYANVDLMNPVIYQVHNTYKNAALTPLENKHHIFEVNGTKFKNLKDEFKELKGDYLKTKILEDFQNRIENTSSEQELKDLKAEIMDSDEYKVLHQGQNLITIGKTSSEKALNSMFAEQEQNIINAQTPQASH